MSHTIIEKGGPEFKVFGIEIEVSDSRDHKTINHPFLDIGSFSKFGSPCIENQDYFPLPAKQESYTNAELQRLYLLRASVILYCLGKKSIGNEMPH